MPRRRGWGVAEALRAIVQRGRGDAEPDVRPGHALVQRERQHGPHVPAARLHRPTRDRSDLHRGDDRRAAERQTKGPAGHHVAAGHCPGAQRHIPDGHADIRRRGDDVRGASHELLPGLARLTPRPGAQHRLNRGATRWTRLPRAHALVRRHRGLHRNRRVHHPNRGVRVQVHDDRRRGVARLGAIQAQRRGSDV